MLCVSDFIIKHAVASTSTTHADRLYCIQLDQEETLSVRDMLSNSILVLEILEEEKSNNDDLSPALCM